MFCVVQFVESKEVDVVPLKWINGNICHWPTTSVSQKAQKQANVEESWSRYEVSVLKKTESWLKARAKARKYCQVRDSDTISSTDFEAPRKRFGVDRFIENDSNVFAQENMKIQPPSSTPFPPHSSESTIDANFSYTMMPDTGFSLNPSLPGPLSDRGILNSMNILNDKALRNRIQPGTIKNVEFMISALYREVCRQSLEIKDLRQQLDGMAKQSPIEIKEDVQYPFFVTMNDLKTKTISEALRSKMLCEGGDTPKQCVRRVMVKLMSTSVKRNTNRQGSYGKEKLPDDVVALIIASVQRHFANTTTKEIEVHISNTLKNARDADGGYIQRKSLTKHHNKRPLISSDTDE